MTGRTLVIARDADGNLRFHDADNLAIDRTISSVELARLRKAVASSRSGLVWWDGLYLDEADVDALIRADAELGDAS